MKSYRKDIWFNVPTRRDFINITTDVEQCLSESGIKEGLIPATPCRFSYSTFN